MKPNRKQLLLLIACLFVIAMPVLAQTNSTHALATGGDTSNTALPDAPSVETRRPASPPPAAVQLFSPESVMVTSMLFSSSIANVELTTRCLENGACTKVPSALRSRGALYGVSLPADVGITVLGYYLRRSGHRWWFVPAAMFTVGNAIYAVHASQHMR
jgi:ABC-type cobalt transport system substrate-binding protein